MLVKSPPARGRSGRLPRSGRARAADPAAPGRYDDCRSSGRARSSLASPVNWMRPRSITCARLASPSATVANCSMSSTPTPDSATVADRRDEALDDDRSEPERELVDEDEARLGHERLGEDEHLLLAARERPRREVEPLLSSGNSSSAYARPGRASSRASA